MALTPEQIEVKEEWKTLDLPTKRARRNELREWFKGLGRDRIPNGEFYEICMRIRIPYFTAHHIISACRKKSAKLEVIETRATKMAIQTASDRMAAHIEKALASDFDRHVAEMKEKIKKRLDQLDRMIGKMLDGKQVDPSIFEVVVRTEDRLDQMNRRAYEKDTQKVDVTSNGQSVGAQMITLITQCRENLEKLGNPSLDRLMEAEIVVDSPPGTGIPASAAKPADLSKLSLESPESEGLN